MESVTISRAEYEDLLDSKKFLSYLIACGVDNWDGYDLAIDMIEDEGL